MRYDRDLLPEQVQLLLEAVEIILTPSWGEQIRSPIDAVALLRLQMGFQEQEQMRGCPIFQPQRASV